MSRGVAAGAGLLLVLLASCSAQAEQPSTLPPLPASASPSGSPSPSSSPSPSPAASPVGTDLQQITALARDYYLESNRAIRTGDTTRLRSLSIPNCECQSFAKNVESVWAAGGAVSPVYYNISGVARPTLTSSTEGYATVLYTINKAMYLDKTGKVIQTFPADRRPQSASVDFKKIDGIWKVSLAMQN